MEVKDVAKMRNGVFCGMDLIDDICAKLEMIKVSGSKNHVLKFK